MGIGNGKSERQAGQSPSAAQIQYSMDWGRKEGNGVQGPLYMPFNRSRAQESTLAGTFQH